MKCFLKQIYSVILISFLALLNSCSTGEIDFNAKSIINGGVEYNLSDYSDEDSFYDSIKVHTVAAYWKEKLLGLSFGPVFSNYAETLLKNDFITNVNLFDAEYSSKYMAMETKSAMFVLTSSVTITELISFLLEHSVELEFSLYDLVTLYMDAFLDSDSSILDFLNYLLENGFISEITYDELVTFITDSGFTLESSLSELQQFLEFNDYTTLVFIGQVIQFIDEFNLTYNIDIDELISLLESMGLTFDISVLELIELFNEFGFVVNEELDLLKAKLASYKPEMHITKPVMQEFAWFGWQIEYVIEFENKGNFPASEFIIIDHLDPLLDFAWDVSSNFDVSTNVYYTERTSIVTFEFDDDIPAKAKGYISFKVNIKE